jgi:hypothetical protein
MSDPRYTGPGYLYVLRDPLNDNVMKIGLSKDPFARVKQLDRTGNALPLVHERIWWVSDMDAAEKIAHARLAPHRIRRRREFFAITDNPFEQDFEEILDVYRDVLLELIENDLDARGVNCMDLNIQALWEHYLANGRTLP